MILNSQNIAGITNHVGVGGLILSYFDNLHGTNYGVVNIHSSFAVVYSADSHTLVVIEEFLKKGKGKADSLRWVGITLGTDELLSGYCNHKLR